MDDAYTLSRQKTGNSQTYTGYEMTMRSCTDRSGVCWEIFEVQPNADGRAIDRMPEAFRSGWLCFQSATERRRLTPIPLGWGDWTERELLGALPYGQRSPRRTPPNHRLQPHRSGNHERQL
jgi:hypothetical protein